MKGNNSAPLSFFNDIFLNEKLRDSSLTLFNHDIYVKEHDFSSPLWMWFMINIDTDVGANTIGKKRKKEEEKRWKTSHFT